MRSRSYITHFANVEDEATGSAYEVFHFDKVDGSRGVAEIPRQMAFDAREVRKELLRLNAKLPLDHQAALKEIAAAIESPPRLAQLHCEGTGWRDGFDAFATLSHVIDTRRRERTLLPPLRLSKEQRRRQEAAGGLEQWRMIAEICGYSDLGMLLLSVSFAASLLAIARRGSFGINVYGRSKIGKSALLVAASSVSGCGEESELPSWIDTRKALPEKARHHRDIPFPINETGSVKRKEVYELVRTLIYALTEGREGDRHSLSGYAILDSSALIRTIFICSMERSMDAYAGLAKESRDEGELARCLDVAATRPGRTTVMDRFPAGVDDPSQRVEWARRQLARLRELCRDNHGLAVEPFVRYLMRDIPRVRREIREDADRFTRWYRPPRLSEAAAHAFDNVAMIYAGGSIAVDAGLLSYDKKELAAAIWRCVRDSIPAIRAQPNPPTRVVRDLRIGMRTARLHRFARDGRFDSERFEGFVTARHGPTTYVVRARDFRAWFDGDPLRFRSALAWLERRGCLRARRVRSEAARRRADWAERAVMWPDGRTVRSIAFFDPFHG